MRSEIFGVAALVPGLLLCLLAAVGILRMPDVYARMQASTKAGTLGIAFIIVAVAIHFGDAITALQAALIIGFLFLTAPIASHLIARSVYFDGKRGWETGAIDEMADMHIIDLTIKAPTSPKGDRAVESETDNPQRG